MATHKIGIYRIEWEFAKIDQYGLYCWDYTIYKEDKEIGSGINIKTISSDEQDAIIEMLLNDSLLDEGI